MEKNNSTIVIGPVRFSYLHCWEPSAMNPGEKERYSVSAIISKKDKATINKIKKAIEVAKQVGKESKFAGKIPTNLKLPLRDGDVDRPEDENYANSYFLSCHSSTQPGIVDKNRNVITDRDEVYSGAFGYLNITFYPFNVSGSKGIAVGFNHLMKTKDGERLAASVDLETAFDEVELDDETDDEVHASDLL